MRRKDNEDPEERRMFSEILKKLNEFSKYMNDNGAGMINSPLIGRFSAFDPSGMRVEYSRYVVLINTIYSIFNDSGINVKSRGYTFLKDAVCIVVDLGSMDVCLTKDVYPLIAKKYGAKELYTIEHNIRNAIDSAFISPGRQKLTKNNIMSGFESRPTNKEFILAASQKVQSLLAETVMNN